MHSSVLYFTFSFLLLSNAAPSNFTISNTELIPCPYKVSATAAPDLSYIDIIYSTKGINPNSLASYGPGVSTARGRTKCYVNVDIDYPFTATRVRVAAIDVEGVSKLDRGITANVETSVMWGYAWSIVRSPCAWF
jgi:hypothetical protein